MRRLGSVQRKMPCVFVTEVKEEPSTKREHQVIRVEGPAGAAARRLLSGALVAFEPGERAWWCRSRLIGRELFAGFVWGTGGGGWREGRGGVSHTELQVLLSCNGEHLQKDFSEQAIQTCPREEIENPHLK